MKGATVARVGAIAFSVFTIAAFVASMPPGGGYSESNIADYLARGHRPAVFLAFYLGLLGVFGLICLLAELRETVNAAPGKQREATILWGTGLAGAGSFAIGWGSSAAKWSRTPRADAASWSPYL